MKAPAEPDGVADAALAARVAKYIEVRGVELGKIDRDARSERGLEGMLTRRCGAPWDEEPPPDGTRLMAPQQVGAEGETRQAPPMGLRPFHTKLIEMRMLRDRTAVAGFDGTDAPFTIRDLHAIGETPDLAMLKSPRDADASEKAASLPPPPKTAEERETQRMTNQAAIRDFGQCIGQQFFDEAGGVDFFLNAIFGAQTKAAKIARRSGTAPNPADAPTSERPDLNPMTVYALWKLARARRKRELAEADPGRAPRDCVAARLEEKHEETDARITEMLASKFWDSLGETREISALHIAYYLFEPCGRERPCVMGQRCIAFLTVYHPLHDAPPRGPPPPPGRIAGSPRRTGVVLKEFLTDIERERFDRFGELPAVHHPCILCMRCNVTFKFILAKMGTLRHASPYHYHPVEVPGGYRRAACIQPQKSSTKGISMPTRPFVTNEYIPTTLDELAWAGALPLTETEIDRMRKECATFVAENATDEARRKFVGKCGLPRLRGFAESGAVLFFEKSKAISPQALSLGIEPVSSYVGALAACARANADAPAIDAPSHEKFLTPDAAPGAAAVVAPPPSSDSAVIIQQQNFAIYPSYLFVGDDREECNADVLSPLMSQSLSRPLRYLMTSGSANFSLSLLSATNLARKHLGDRTATCEQGEHAGRWRHLVLDFATRVGMTIETMDIVLGPFSVLCESIARAVERTEFSAPSSSESADRNVSLTDSELAAAVRRLRLWSTIPVPAPLHRHALVSACFLRTEIAQDVRSSVELDAVAIAKFKAETKRTTDERTGELGAIADDPCLSKYSTWETLADDEQKIATELAEVEAKLQKWAGAMSAGVSSAEFPEGADKRAEVLRQLKAAIAAGRDAWVERKRAATEPAILAAHEKYESRFVPPPPQTRAQRELVERLDRIVAVASSAGMVTHAGVADDFVAWLSKHGDSVPPPAPVPRDESEAAAAPSSCCKKKHPKKADGDGGSEGSRRAARLANLAALILEKRRKRPSQKTLDRLLQAASEFDAAQRPLRRELMSLRRAGAPIDDASLLGTLAATSKITKPCYCRAGLGCLDPDSRTPALRVPRRPMRLTLSPSASTITKTSLDRFDRSGLPERSMLPGPASFCAPDIPVCKVRFPTHRRAARAAILAGDVPNLKLSDRLDNILLLPPLFSGPDNNFPTAKQMLKEFWKSVATTRKAGRATELAMCDALGPFAKFRTDILVGRTGLARPPQVPPSKGPAFGNCGCSIIATAIARMALGNKVCQLATAAKNTVLAFRAFSFTLTHLDLLCAIDWSVDGSWTDEALLRSQVEEEEGDRREILRQKNLSSTSWNCIANYAYPFDTRAATEEDQVSISFELLACGFFEQASNPDISKTLMHVIMKLMPRACEKRACESIMEQTAGSCPAFSVWLLGVLRCFLTGAYPHASRRPSAAAAIGVCERFLQAARADLELRIAEVDRRPLAAKVRPFDFCEIPDIFSLFKRARKCAEMTVAASPLTQSEQFFSSIDLARRLGAAAECITAAVAGGDGGIDGAPVATASGSAFDAITTSVCWLAARRLCRTGTSSEYLSVSCPAFRETFASQAPALASWYCRRRRSDAGPFLDIYEMLADPEVLAKMTNFLSPNMATAAVDAILDSIKILGDGALSCLNPRDKERGDGGTVARAAEEFACIVAEAASEGYTECAVAAGLTAAFSNPATFYGVLRLAIVVSLKVLSETGSAEEAIAALGDFAGAGSETEPFVLRRKNAAAPGSVRAWPLSHESVTEVCTAACSRALQRAILMEGDAFMRGVPRSRLEGHRDAFCRALVEKCRKSAADADQALSCGLADRAMMAVWKTAGDIMDIWSTAVKACCEPNGRAAVALVVDASARAVAEYTGEDPSVITEKLRPAAWASKKRGALQTDADSMSAIASKLLGALASVRCIAQPWYANRKRHRDDEDDDDDEDTGDAEKTGKPKETPLTPEKLMLLAGRLVGETMKFAGSVAECARNYAVRKIKCELLRRRWEYYVSVSAKLVGTTAFVVENATLCQFAVREAVVAQMSRNPALMAGFATRGQWFSDVVEYVVQTCDTIRARIDTDLRVPNETVVSEEIADELSYGKWWANKVYRLQKWDFASRVAKVRFFTFSERKHFFPPPQTAELHEAAITAAGIRVGPAFELHPDAVKLMREYVYACVAASGADRRPNLQRDLDILWCFGMRDHGLSVITQLHAAYNRYGGKNEFYRIVSRFSVSEFLLMMEYYRVLVSANAVSVIPMLCPALSDATAAALRERYGLGDGEIPKQLLELVLCDVCFSVLTQMPPRQSTKPSKLTSCYAVVSGPNGELVCLDKRNSVKKKTGVKRGKKRKSSAAAANGKQKKISRGAAAGSSRKKRRKMSRDDRFAGVVDEENEEDDDADDEEEEEEDEEIEEDEEEEDADEDFDEEHLQKPPKRRRTAAVATRAANSSSRCQKCRTRRGTSVGERLGLRTPLHCQATRVREIPGAGCVVEFSQKYTAKGEKSTDARLPIILSPCCGTWHRFSFDNWGSDGYRCRACSYSRFTGPALPTTCAVCGEECRNSTGKTGTSYSAMAAAAAKKTKKTKQIVTTSMPGTTTTVRSASSGGNAFASPSASSLPPLGGTKNPIKWLPGPAPRSKRGVLGAEVEGRKSLRDGKKRTLKLLDYGDGVDHRCRHHHHKNSDGEEEEEKTTAATEKTWTREADDSATSDDAAEAEAEAQAEASADETGDALASAIIVQSKKKRKAYGSMYAEVPGIEGSMVPAPEDATNVVCVIDDDVTMSVQPIATCKRCFFDYLRIARARPVFISDVRKIAKARIQDPSPFKRLAHCTTRRVWGGGRNATASTARGRRGKNIKF